MSQYAGSCQSKSDWRCYWINRKHIISEYWQQSQSSAELLRGEGLELMTSRPLAAADRHVSSCLPAVAVDSVDPPAAWPLTSPAPPGERSPHADACRCPAAPARSTRDPLASPAAVSASKHTNVNIWSQTEVIEEQCGSHTTSISAWASAFSLFSRSDRVFCNCCSRTSYSISWNTQHNTFTHDTWRLVYKIIQEEI